MITDYLNDGTEQEPAISDHEWQWSRYERVTDAYGKQTTRKMESEADEVIKSEPDDGPFQVIYQRSRDILWPEVVLVAVTSTALMKILQPYFPEDGDLHSLTKSEIYGCDFYAVLESLKSHAARSRDAEESGSCLDDNHGISLSYDAAESSTDERCTDNLGTGSISVHQQLEVGERTKESNKTKDEELGALHLKHLVRFLETEYKDVIVRGRRMKEEKRVSWDMLWTFLSEGTKVAYYCDYTGELLCGIVTSDWYGDGYFCLELKVRNFDGKQYKACQIQRYIREFERERDFGQLPVSPVEMLENPASLDAEFLANGKRFYELAVKSTNRFMLYRGPMMFIQGDNLCKTKSDGRVMIDLMGFAAMNPGYPMGNARPPVPPRPGSGVKSSTATKYVPPKVLDESLIFAPAIVYGFSFSLKEWGCFAVSGFSDITFDTEAFQELAMDPSTKCLIHNLAAQYLCPSADQDDSVERVSSRLRVDPISAKGEGCIFLCYGPPGTGKTLTAESLAEKMMQPLWVLSVSELGTTPKELEVKLVRVLDIAGKWHAVLLLDEADVYLEKRTSGGDLVRNAITGVFLRLLEYYQGVLFLTTNRISTFDDAFRSRISVFLQYPLLTVETKGKIWKTLLTRVGVQELSEKFCEEMAAKELNGREIRNVIHMAQTWARSNGEVLAMSHIKYVSDILAHSLKALNEELHVKV